VYQDMIPQIEISQVTAWPETVYFARRKEDGLPYIHPLAGELTCFAFESEDLLQGWITEDGGTSWGYTLVKTWHDCAALLKVMQQGEASLVWLNPTVSVSVPAIFRIQQVIDHIEGGPPTADPTP
jgi:hypothetical protein